jgi:phosphatase NudJ
MGNGAMSSTSTRTSERWRPNVTVAAVVERDGRYLLVEERAADGSFKLNNPAGHLDPGETLLQAVVREVLEETACVFTPTHLQGIHLAPSATDEVTYLRFAFAGSVSEPLPGRALDDGIVRTLWLTPGEIAAERARHRSALLMRCIEDHRAGRRYPLDVLLADESFYAAPTQVQERVTMTSPQIAQKAPFPVTVEAGKDYWWCACGQSKNQPFCDGSHKAAGVFTPIKYTATESATVYFCGCKHSANKPLCDGTHKSL